MAINPFTMGSQKAYLSCSTYEHFDIDEPSFRPPQAIALYRIPVV